MNSLTLLLPTNITSNNYINIAREYPQYKEQIFKSLETPREFADWAFAFKENLEECWDKVKEHGGINFLFWAIDVKTHIEECFIQLQNSEIIGFLEYYPEFAEKAYNQIPEEDIALFAKRFPQYREKIFKEHVTTAKAVFNWIRWNPEYWEECYKIIMDTGDRDTIVKWMTHTRYKQQEIEHWLVQWKVMKGL